MNPNVVLEFLQEHPQFLEENAHLLLGSGEYENNAVSLTERHIKRLREEKTQLQAQIRQLIRAGNENDAISEKMHRTMLALFMADSLSATLEILKKIIKEDFQVPLVAVRVWGAKNNAVSLTAVSPEVTPKRLMRHIAGVKPRRRYVAGFLVKKKRTEVHLRCCRCASARFLVYLRLPARMKNVFMMAWAHCF